MMVARLNLTDLLATIQQKDNEIAVMQNKLLKRQYRIKALKKKLAETDLQ